MKDCKSQMNDLANRWYQAVRRPSESEEDESEELTPDDNPLRNIRD